MWQPVLATPSLKRDKLAKLHSLHSTFNEVEPRTNLNSSIRTNCFYCCYKNQGGVTTELTPQEPRMLTDDLALVDQLELKLKVYLAEETAGNTAGIGLIKIHF